MKYVNLKTIKISEENFYKLLECFPSRVKVVKSINDGLKEFRYHKRIVYYNNEDTILCEASKLSLVMKINVPSWQHLIIRKSVNNEVETNFKSELTGPQALNILVKMLKKKYTKEAIINILESYKDTYDESLKQYHFVGLNSGYTEYDNCYKYDINGAHTDAIIEMFPLARNILLKYANKKYDDSLSTDEKNWIKQVFNLAVGQLKHIGYEGAYYHIVHRTTNILLDAIEKTDGRLLYANTDGFIVQQPKTLLKVNNKKYGAFKLENNLSRKIYSYVDKNYWVIQYYDINDNIKTTGSCLETVREYIDLPNKEVVHYERKKVNEYGFDIMKPANIVKEKLC